jgi:hypothetical protein
MGGRGGFTVWLANFEWRIQTEEMYLQLLLEHVYLFTTTRGLIFIVLCSSFSLAKVNCHIGWQFVYMFRSCN